MTSIGPGRCPECGYDHLTALSDGEAVNFFCDSCLSCWHVELGYVRRVDPATCPGCPTRPCRDVAADRT